ncbi:hypothetical protein EPJ64_06500 [Brachyspira aalborgi]|uniref:hypothetical protein n=3 Tax=Brachyspira aalborgi TaxID=29522 RepID=UPI0011C7A35C|nr:hypothetical protein [Brachyspira aalborgi]TXJ14348.1 hypothetical protein EPJ77_11145 [Brachyspira aalborgi]TXJ19126.1 hypothetical protein EPJ64_06500 [Brachyspira aalborgi]TXJ47259.1 hypothetical protein EPJ75_11150 [Brachyspira aalborgi]
MGYDKKIAEEELKNKVASDYFTTKNFDSTQIIGKIDFCIAKKINKKDKYLKTQNNFNDKEFEAEYYLWAEAKKGNKHDFIESFVQLILTIGKGRIYDKHLPPAFLGEFDAEQIAFLPYHKIMDVFSQNDFNWNVTPSNHNTKEFKQLYEMVKNTLEEESFIFKFGKDDKEIEDFIKNNFGKTGVENNLSKTQIDKNNFVNIYSKWLVSVKNSISVDWDMAKKNGIIDADFYLADLLSENNLTLIKKLFVILKTDHYELDRKIDDMGLITSKQSHFYDNQKAHKEFWKRYHRPPKTEYWDYIINRRDLLVPQDIRERKGSFFTPQIWVEKSQDYIAEVLGESWQEEYYIWDLAAGTGNLLAGLVNKYNIFASTIDQADVDIMLERVDNGANLLKSHIFKFDFLNDDFSKLPKELKKVIEEKPEKLIIYINPPYAEATSATTPTGTGKNKSLVARGNKISEDYKDILGKANNEIFAQFFMRIYKEIPNCIFSSFSTLKYLNSTSFIRFREYFKAKFLKGFIVPAYTFDNVKGKFPIGFLIWDTSKKEKIENITVDIYDITNEPDNNGQLPIVSKSQKNMQETNGSQRKNTQGVTTPCYIGRKSFYGDLSQSINKWIKGHDNKNAMQIVGYMENPTPDFQNNSFLCIINKHGTRHNNYYAFSPSNFFIGCIYFYVRHCIPHNWINNNDQFLYPNDNWEKDLEFQSDCLTFTLFHGHNRISAEEGINHWIPFSEAEVEAKNNFESHFMKDFIDGKIKPKETKELLTERRSPKPIKFSKEAKEIFEAGRELWKYYHKHDLININASYYDIRKFFQGVDSKSGRMNNKSIDETYNKLIGNLRERMKILAKKIEPKIYEFGFLKK